MVEQVGINFVSTGEDKVKKAYADLSKAEDQLQQKMTVGANVGNKNAKSLDQIVSASKKAENEIRRLAQAHQQGKINADQFKNELTRISNNLRSMGMTRARTEVFNLGKAYNSATTEVAKQTAELRKLQGALNQTAGSKVRVAAAAKTTTDATSRTRQAFLNTANSIAILDGPLGGIASRFSAFGVLIGRTGVALGVFAVGISALGVIATKSVRAFMEFEVQTAKIEAILKTTGSQAGLTASEIEGMASRIALSTLESESAIRDAATQLLTFKNVGKDVFETTLKAATDMAALGFGTVQSESVKLAKALDDPRQSLTSLSRSGITFTRQQRQLIVSLVESGRQAEAMDRILENVNRQVGGAGEAAARDTMAGSFDTIGQAVSRASREVGAFVANSVGLRYAIGRVADSVAEFAGGASPVETAIENLENLRKRSAAWFSISGGMAPILAELPTDLPERVELAVKGARSYQDAIKIALDYLNETNSVMLSLAAATQARTQAQQRLTAVDNLRAEADAIRENIGLTEQQIRVNRALAAEGLLRVDISAEMDKYVTSLQKAGTSQSEIIRLATEFHQTLLDGVSAGEALANALRDAASYKDPFSMGDAESDVIAKLYADVADELSRVKDEQEEIDALWKERNAANALEAALEYLDAFVAGQQDAMNNTKFLNANLGQMERVVSRTADEAIRLRDALASAGRASLGRIDQITVLQAQIAAARRGASVSGAAAGTQTAISLSRSGATADQIAAAAVTASGEAETIDKLQKTLSDLTRTESGRSSGGGGGSNVIDITEIIAAREQQIMQERILIGLSGQRRIEEEIYFDLMKQNKDANIKLTESEIRGEAQKLAALQQTNDVLKEQRDIQEQLSGFIESSMEKAFMSIVDGTMSVKDAFKSMASDIIKELYRIFVVKKITGMIAGAFGGGGVKVPTSVLSAIVPSANGNIFASGNVVPFANGGVVGGPTTFPMSGGKTGLMGEAGPEAIMPLKRGKDGKLGVTAEGGGNVTVNNYFTVQANGDESVKRIVQQQIPRIAEATKAAVVDSKRRGGSYGRAFG